jgi:hypothetical protein
VRWRINLSPNTQFKRNKMCGGGCNVAANAE